MASATHAAATVTALQGTKVGSLTSSATQTVHFSNPNPPLYGTHECTPSRLACTLWPA